MKLIGAGSVIDGANPSSCQGIAMGSETITPPTWLYSSLHKYKMWI